MEKTVRVIATEKDRSIGVFFRQWEFLLIVLFIGINIMNALISPYYMNVPGLLNATSSFLEKAFIALPMVYILILGEIDISVASTVALSSVLMGVSYNNLGLPMIVSILICIITGTLCGFTNGFILTRYKELAPMIVTLGTQILYRGIATMILKDQSTGNFPSWFSEIYWGGIASIPYMLIVFVVCAIIFGLILHKTSFGRKVYAIGSNSRASRYSGVKVDRIRLIIYTITGTMAGVTALFLTSRMGSTRPNIAQGYELEAIAMVVLGGISTSGGKGRFVGAILAIFIVGLLRYGLGLVNITSQVMLIVIGTLLIVAVMLPNMKGKK